jgi:exosortase/archaeosortase
MWVFIRWPIFGIFAILQGMNVCKIKNILALAVLFLLGPFGSLFAYFVLPKK